MDIFDINTPRFNKIDSSGDIIRLKYSMWILIYIFVQSDKGNKPYNENKEGNI